MSLRNHLCLLTMTVLAASGCDSDLANVPELASAQHDSRCVTCPPDDWTNGRGVNIGYTDLGAFYGAAGPEGKRWYLTGFTNNQPRDGRQSVIANGWYEDGNQGVVAVNAAVTSALWNGTSHTVTEITTGGRESGTALTVQLDHSLTLQGTNVSGAALVGLVLNLAVPSYASGGLLTYQLLIDRIETPLSDNRYGDVNGYHFFYKSTEAGIPDWTNYCSGQQRADLPAVLYQGAHWHPLTGERTDGANRVALTCRTGAIAQCMEWGYRPWVDATNVLSSPSQIERLKDTHQSCIHMKRASYCGDGNQYTHSGVKLLMTDDFGGAFSQVVTPVSLIEAYWQPTGATCLSTPRLSGSSFNGWCNGNKLPACPTQVNYQTQPFKLISSLDEQSN